MILGLEHHGTVFADIVLIGLVYNYVYYLSIFRFSHRCFRAKPVI